MEEVESWQQDPNVSLLKPNYFLSAALASLPVFARPSLLALNLLTGEFPGTKEAQGGDEAPVATALTKRSRPDTRSPAQPCGDTDSWQCSESPSQPLLVQLWSLRAVKKQEHAAIIGTSSLALLKGQPCPPPHSLLVWPQC